MTSVKQLVMINVKVVLVGVRNVKVAKLVKNVAIAHISNIKKARNELLAFFIFSKITN